VHRRPTDGNTYYTIETTLGLEGRTVSAAVVVHRRFPEFRQLARRIDKLCPGLAFLDNIQEGSVQEGKTGNMRKSSAAPLTEKPEKKKTTTKTKAKTALAMLPPKTRNFTTKSKREAEEFLMRRREGLQVFFDELLAVGVRSSTVGGNADENAENVNGNAENGNGNIVCEDRKPSAKGSASRRSPKRATAGVYDIPHLAAFLGLGDKRCTDTSIDKSLENQSSPISPVVRDAV
jgi:hypothetical protein